MVNVVPRRGRFELRLRLVFPFASTLESENFTLLLKPIRAKERTGPELWCASHDL